MDQQDEVQFSHRSSREEPTFWDLDNPAWAQGVHGHPLGCFMISIFQLEEVSSDAQIFCHGLSAQVLWQLSPPWEWSWIVEFVVPCEITGLSYLLYLGAWLASLSCRIDSFRERLLGKQPIEWTWVLFRKVFEDIATVDQYFVPSSVEKKRIVAVLMMESQGIWKGQQHLIWIMLYALLNFVNSIGVFRSGTTHWTRRTSADMSYMTVQLQCSGATCETSFVQLLVSPCQCELLVVPISQAIPDIPNQLQISVDPAGSRLYLWWFLLHALDSLVVNYFCSLQYSQFKCMFHPYDLWLEFGNAKEVICVGIPFCFSLPRRELGLRRTKRSYEPPGEMNVGRMSSKFLHVLHVNRSRRWSFRQRIDL